MLDRLIGDIDRALDNNCYFAALALALTLPDICGQAADPTTKLVGERYKNWCREHVCKDLKPSSPYTSDMPYLNEEIIYQLRCAFLHQGNPNIAAKNIKEDQCKVNMFGLIIDDKDCPDTGESMVSYGNGHVIEHRELTIGIHYLCDILAKAAKHYYRDHPGNFANLFKYHLIDKDGEDIS